MSMEKIIEYNAAARAEGKSYGAWMSENREFRSFRRPVGKHCVVCGGLLVGAQQRFCTNECRAKHRIRTLNGGKFV